MAKKTTPLVGQRISATTSAVGFCHRAVGGAREDSVPILIKFSNFPVGT